MIPLKITQDGHTTKYMIKSINELTTREFIKLSKIENPSIIDYLAISTGITYDKACEFKIEKPWLIQKAIGEIPDIEKLPVPEWTNKNVIETIGQRYLIETNSEKFKNYDLIVFVMAVAMKRTMNIDEIYKYMEYLYNRSFIEVIPAARFFFLNFKYGKSKGNIILNLIRKLIKILYLKRELA